MKRIEELFSGYREMGLFKKALIMVLAVAAAILLGSVFVVMSGSDPIEAYYYMMIKPLSSIGSIGEVFIYFTPLLLVGLGVCFTFHCKLSNLGGEGQILFGALGMTLVGISPIARTLGPVSLLLGALTGILFGTLYAAMAAWFRALFNASEIVITLMLNYIAEQIISYIIFYHLRTGAEPQSAKIACMIPKIFSNSRINYGVVTALLLIIVYYVLVYRTKFGYNLRTLGGSRKAAKYGGVSAKRYYFYAMMISGAFCGLAGMMQVAGNTGRLMSGVAADFGFGGIVVALLGNLHPVGVLVAAFFMALITAGSVTMQVKTGIPTSFASILEALIVLFILLGMAVSA
ncbi:MAG: ABC transporter permease, partial [Erysipelotrichaceae bacterium]|nr:ABC transporter permease [Erysipelotrichaceae bacterium]